MKETSIRERFRIVPTKRLLADYLDRERIGAACRTCPEYGVRWCCPPFAHDPFEALDGLQHTLIVASRSVPIRSCEGSLHELYERSRVGFDAELLALERSYPSSRAALPGACRLCEECGRGAGIGCRHPDRMRPSIEALGFDVGRMTAELLGWPLDWGTDGRPTRRCTLVGALFAPTARVRWQRPGIEAFECVG